MDRLPHELISMIYGFLDRKSMGRLSACSRALYGLISRQVLVYRNFARVAREINMIEHYISLEIKMPSHSRTSILFMKDKYCVYSVIQWSRSTHRMSNRRYYADQLMVYSLIDVIFIAMREDVIMFRREHPNIHRYEIYNNSGEWDDTDVLLLQDKINAYHHQYLVTLPDELISMIYGFLDRKSMGRLSVCSRTLHSIAPHQLLCIYRNFARVMKEISMFEYETSIGLDDKRQSILITHNKYCIYLRSERYYPNCNDELLIESPPRGICIITHYKTHTRIHHGYFGTRDIHRFAKDLELFQNKIDAYNKRRQ